MAHARIPPHAITGGVLGKRSALSRPRIRSGHRSDDDDGATSSDGSESEDESQSDDQATKSKNLKLILAHMEDNHTKIKAKKTKKVRPRDVASAPRAKRQHGV